MTEELKNKQELSDKLQEQLQDPDETISQPEREQIESQIEECNAEM